MWKPIPDYPMYECSELGEIRRDGKILKQNPYCNGYLKVALCRNGTCCTKKVHRLVMLTFEGPSDLEVNHINGIKTDNRRVNLEYCTKSENQLHYYRLNGARPCPHKGKTGASHPRSVPVSQYDKGWNLIRTFSGGAQAQRETGISSKAISRCVNGNGSAGGYFWKFATK